MYYDDILKINEDTVLPGMGVDQLKEPFISLGLASCKEEVDALIRSVDTNSNGKIDFEEFLDIIKNQGKKKGGVQKNEKITAFFKNLSENNFVGNSNLAHFSFKTVMNIMRRENLLKYFLSKDEEEKKEGAKILKAYSNMLQENKGKNKSKQK